MELFAYGTLLPGLAPPELEPLLGRLRRAGAAEIAGLLFDLGPYPALVVEPGAILAPSAPSERERFEIAWAASLPAASLPAPGPGEAGRQAGGRRLVRGELFDLPADAEVLAELDRYEGAGGSRADLYERIRARVHRLDSREAVDAWVYAFPRAPRRGQPVPGGDYRRHRASPGGKW